MLQEVSQTALAVLLLDSSHTLSDVEVSHMLGILVVTDVIGQSVVQFTDLNGGVYGDGRHLHLLSYHRCGAEYHQQGHENFL